MLIHRGIRGPDEVTLTIRGLIGTQRTQAAQQKGPKGGTLQAGEQWQSPDSCQPPMTPRQAPDSPKALLASIDDPRGQQPEE